MKIQLYENWMKPQVIKLFCSQYGTKEYEQESIMENFYEHPFQKEKGIRIVALDQDKVIGFQSLFYWPYQKDGLAYNTFQSGNSVVHPDYRGKGIFQKLLNYLDDYNKDLKIDFLMGFPVQQSYGSFIKNKWANPLNLNWYLTIINPLGFIFSINKITSSFDKSPEPIIQNTLPNTFRLVDEIDFEKWRSSFSDQSKYCFFNFAEHENKISFSLKINKRNKWFNELIIGDIRSSTNDHSFIKKSISKLKIRAFKNLGVTAITIALNEHSTSTVKDIITKKKFFKTKKSIYFITKSFNEGIEINDPDKWELYRSDIDTW